jgi:HPt (histidine-containing phosphotransfer) domain-containing protein
MSSAFEMPEAAKLISQLLLQDADLREVVEEFVRGLQVRIAELKQAHEHMDWDHLVTLAHRLKGAAGSYGYPDISQLCAEMERRFRAHESDAFTDWMDRLSQMAVAADEGLKEVS